MSTFGNRLEWEKEIDSILPDCELILNLTKETLTIKANQV